MTTTRHRGLKIITGSARLPGDLQSCPRPAGEPSGLGHEGLCTLSPSQDPDPRPGASSPRVLKIVVPGRPRGKPRMTRRDKWKQRPCVMAYREWADSVRAAAGQLPQAHEVRALSWLASFTPPSSWSQDRQAEAIGSLHRQKPDRDNIDKAVLDILFPQGDQGIASGAIEKRWGEVDQLTITIWLNNP